MQYFKFVRYKSFLFKSIRASISTEPNFLIHKSEKVDLIINSYIFYPQ